MPSSGPLANHGHHRGACIEGRERHDLQAGQKKAVLRVEQRPSSIRVDHYTCTTCVSYCPKTVVAKLPAAALPILAAPTQSLQLPLACMGQRRLCSQALSVSSGVMSWTSATYLQGRVQGSFITQQCRTRYAIDAMACGLCGPTPCCACRHLPALPGFH